MHKPRIIFICVHNAARSQMAEAFLKKHGSDLFDVESAGYHPTEINPFVVEAMKEKGIDLSKNSTQSVFDLYRNGRLFDISITVCRESEEENCPVFPGIIQRERWEFDDPSSLAGTKEDTMNKVREIRESIEQRIVDFVNAYKREHA